MDKNDILKALKNKVYYAELPSKMDVCLNNNTLHIIIGADGVLQNMQNDASAFIACRMVYRELSLGNSCRKQERDH